VAYLKPTKVNVHNLIVLGAQVGRCVRPSVH